MRRRDFITLIGGATILWPLAVHARQSERLARIGYLNPVPAERSTRDDEAFREGLRDFSYVEGKNIRIEYRSTDGDNSRIPVLLAELIGLKVDVIVTYANGVFAALQATKTIPIVMAVGPDPVALGLVASLSHPGGNVTGSSFFISEMMAKRLELIKELLPATTRAGVMLVHREDDANANILEVMGATAKALKVELYPIEVRTVGDFENVFSAWGSTQVAGVIMGDHGLLT